MTLEDKKHIEQYEKRIEQLDKMKDLILELSFFEGNKNEDSKSIDKEIEKLRKKLIKTK